MDAMAARYDQCLGMTREGLFETESTYCVRLGEEEALGRVSVDAAAFEDCLADFAAYPCTTLQDFRGGPASCPTAFSGTVPNGGACRLMGSFGECASGHCAPFEGCGQEGECVAWKESGDDCAGEFDSCAPGLVCGDDAKCASIVVAAADAPCGGNITCSPELFCDVHLDRCVPRAPLDQSCDYNDDNRREYNPCVEGGACTSRNTCVRSKHLRESCTPGDIECDYGTWCKGETSQATTGTCTAWPTVGGECGVLDNGEVRECSRSWCDDESTGIGTCRAYLVLGAECDADSTMDDHRMCGPDAQCIANRCQRAYCNY